MSKVTISERLQDWYRRQCNGDWEHTYGIQIETLDNPGWLVTIDLVDTTWEHLSMPRKIVQRSEMDWVQSEVIEGKFVGSGGPNNLDEILELFLGATQHKA